MRTLITCAALCCQPALAHADFLLACTFETLPQAVMTYPDDRSKPATMQVDSRPPVEIAVGMGSNHGESAEIDGYSFVFWPSTSKMDVSRGTEPSHDEVGRCAAINGPVNDTPISIAAPGEAAESDLAKMDAQTVVVPDKGLWVVSEDKSALDDSTTVVASLESSTVLPSQYGGMGRPALILRCKENKTSAFLTVMDFFLSDIQGYGRVDYRVDDRKALHTDMEVSTDNHALGYWGGNPSTSFIKSLFDGKSVVVRLTPYNESPLEFSFTVTGVEAAVKPLREACKW